MFQAPVFKRLQRKGVEPVNSWVLGPQLLGVLRKAFKEGPEKVLALFFNREGGF